MRFFDRDWVDSNLSDAEIAYRVSEYEKYTKSIIEDLPTELNEFINRFSLHDAIVVKVFVVEGKNLVEVTYLAGDLEWGYFEHKFTYKECKIDDTKYLESLIGYRRRSVIADEIEIRNQRCFHSLIFYPDGELYFEFSDINIVSKKLKERKITYFGDPLIIE